MRTKTLIRYIVKERWNDILFPVFVVLMLIFTLESYALMCLTCSLIFTQCLYRYLLLLDDDIDDDDNNKYDKR